MECPNCDSTKIVWIEFETAQHRIKSHEVDEDGNHYVTVTFDDRWPSREADWQFECQTCHHTWKADEDVSIEYN